MITLLGFLMLTLHFEDHHSYGNYSEVRPTHLSLDLSLDFDKKVINGICELTLEYPHSKEAVAFLFLDVNDLTIHKVTAGGKSLRHVVDMKSGFMGQRLRIHLPSPKPTKVRVYYTTDPGAGAVQWLSPEQTTSGKHPFLFTQSQSILARTWIPCMDSPGARVTYDAVVRVPTPLTAVMSAEHGKHDPPEGVFRFALDRSIPPYLIALAVGELGFKPLSERTGVYAEPAILDAAAAEFVDVERMVQVSEKLFGPYLWKRWDTIVLPPSFPFGGMENPLLTFATPTIIAGDRSLMSLMAHELAHSWSGNLITNATWQDFWLNEGFTTYAERRIVEEVYNRDLAEMQKLLGQRDLEDTIQGYMESNPEFTKLRVNLDGRDPDDAFSDVPYEKGSNFLLMLENTFGRETFDAFLRKYFSEFAFQSMTTERFLLYMEKELFKGDLSWYEKLNINQWIFGTGLPDNLPTPKSRRFDKTRAAAKAFADTGDLSGVQKDDWVTAEWLDFLNSLPEGMSQERMKKIDQTFDLTNAGNSEILFAWLRHVILSNYEPAYASLESFLTRQGRRKFLKPLYEAMMASSKETMAMAIYKKARPGYHPISSNTIDAIVGWGR